MAKVLNTSDSGVTPVIEQTVTTKTVSAAGSPAPLFGAPPVQRKSASDDINEWFSRMTAAERANDFNYYLYRLDKHVMPISGEVDSREPRKYLAKLTPEILARLSGGAFMDELVDWIKDPNGGNFGGGKFNLKIIMRKTGQMQFSKFVQIEGEPRLAQSEQAVDGAVVGSSETASTIRMMVDLLDRKLESVKAGNTDAAGAVSQVTSVLMNSQSQMFQWLLEKQKMMTPDPTQQLTQFRETLGLVRELMPKSPEQTIAKPPTMTEQMQAIVSMMELADKVRRPAPAENQGNLKELIVAAVKEIVPRGKSTDWGTVIVDGISKIANSPIGAVLAHKLQNLPVGPNAAAAPGGIRIVARGAQGQAPSGPSAPATGGPAANPSGMPGGGGIPATGMRPGGPGTGMPGNAAPPIPSGAPAPPPATAAVEGQEIVSADTVNAIIRHTISTRLVDMLRHDREGADAAASIDDMFPDVALQMKFASLEMLNTIIAQDDICKQVKDDPRFPAFLESFYEYFHPKDGEEEPEQVQ